MKANELMIGDWVLCNGSAGRITDFVSCHGYGSKYEYCFGVDYTTNVSGDKKYSPIPLTEEMLMVNGFVNKNPDVTRRTLTNEFGNHKSVAFIVPNNRVHIYNDATKILNIKTQYVHELQHALRLCGMNDLADNFKLE